MLTSLSRFTVALALASSILGATIPAVPSRRSGELWAGAEHEEVDPVGLAASRRSGELWEGAEHEEVDPVVLTPSRRSGELWEGTEHEEVSASTDLYPVIVMSKELRVLVAYAGIYCKWAALTDEPLLALPTTLI
ncbi:uncharacterized protein EDB91DRAFT_1343819 [Suillus paluster]|uniref:uncharacterized protein n=1 Tax=Suillus paluster TaxID=48578 RepID=UPI001B86AA54|nr:uncharacterized protein EDB91DRAFT_1343819 [Suillus paluster]KAG1751347.1 hypothetical protein EDB91DRAFT_1343819 [Suillus paluster]